MSLYYISLLRRSQSNQCMQHTRLSDSSLELAPVMLLLHFPCIAFYYYCIIKKNADGIKMENLLAPSWIDCISDAVYYNILALEIHGCLNVVINSSFLLCVLKMRMIVRNHPTTFTLLNVLNMSTLWCKSVAFHTFSPSVFHQIVLYCTNCVTGLRNQNIFYKGW